MKEESKIDSSISKDCPNCDIEEDISHVLLLECPSYESHGAPLKNFLLASNLVLDVPTILGNNLNIPPPIQISNSRFEIFFFLSLKKLILSFVYNPLKNQLLN